MNEITTSTSKPTPALRKTIKINFKSFCTALAKTGINLLTSKFDSANENARGYK